MEGLHTNVASLLLRGKADISPKDVLRRTPLHIKYYM